jgi:hypothetical protein
MINASAWANRQHLGRPTVALALSAEDRTQLEDLLGKPTVEKRIFLRGQALLFMADAVPACDIARLLGVHERTVFEWKQRFTCDKPLERLKDAPRPGRPPSLSRTRTAQRS